MGMVAAVDSQQFQPWKAVADFVEHEGRAIAILYLGRLNDDAHRRAFGIDERVDLAAVHFLAGVVACNAVVTAPFFADFSDWLSMRRRQSGWLGVPALRANPCAGFPRPRPTRHRI